jgi:RecB family exonuclease
VITPRRTQLVRVPELHSFRQAIARLARRVQGSGFKVLGSVQGSGFGVQGSTQNPEPSTQNPTQHPAPRTLNHCEDVVIVVPTRAAAAILQRTLGDVSAAETRMPAIVTRDELYDLLHARLASPPRRLTALERDVIAQAAARAAAAGEELSFQLRPGLVAEMLRFYDHLRRQSQHVDRFEELILEALGRDDVDRATARMRVQTRFLARAFREYERRVKGSGACDEHTLREQLIAEPASEPVRRAIVTVADWIADADGLYSADFDLLARIPGLEALDLVATERVLGSGFHERLHGWWPGLDEADGAPATAARPVLLTPPDALPEEPWWTHRDREEELVAVARYVKAGRRHGTAVPLHRTAIVFKRPLPYLYPAAEIFGAAGIPYEAFDALPLAAEPTSAALDLVLDAAASNFTRGTLVALLRSPHFVFRHDEEEITRNSVAALDRALSQARYLGGLDRLEALAEAAAGASAPALHAALAAARDLAPLADPHPAAAQIARLNAFQEAHLRPIEDDDLFASRERRARAAVAGTLTALAAVHATHDDAEWTIDELGIAVRHWLGEQTFAVDSDASAGGVNLVDDQAARYGDFDDIAIVGVVEADWPERPRRNIFYPPAVLKSLGWPPEKDRRGADDARFLDLLSSALRRTLVSTFTLDEDALVTRSMQLDEIPRARLSAVAGAHVENARIFLDEALSLEPVALEAFDGDARAWAELRASRSPADAADFHGTVRDVPARAWSVSAIETYLDCPFKFFAQHVLKLEEEPEDEEIMDPRRQGQFVHDVFEAFFRAWQAAGHRAITPQNLHVARELFTSVVDRALERLPEAEAGLERTRLLGSPAAAGLGDAVFRMEAERPAAVVERLLEQRLDGDIQVVTAQGPRTISVRGKADRIDLLADGSFRLIDYKLGWPPNRARALQLPIYSLSAEQQLAGRRGRDWALGEAVYLAFKGPRRVVPLFATPADRAKVLADAQQRLADTVDAIERGEFPPTPDDVWRCESCSFASVCRKDYVGDV